MSDQTLVACPSCQKRYKIQVTQTKVVQCSQCSQKFRVHAPAPVAQFANQPEIVAASVAPAPSRSSNRGAAGKPAQPSGMSGGVKLLIAGLAVGFLLLLMCAGLATWAYPTFVEDAAVADVIESGDSAQNIAHDADFNSAESINPAKHTPVESSRNPSVSVKPTPTPTPTPTPRSAGGAASAGGKVAYDFLEGQQYTFSFDFDVELGKQKSIQMNGSSFLTKLPRGDLPLQVGEFGDVSGGKNAGGNRQVLQTRTFMSMETKDSNHRYGISSPSHENYEGAVELDNAGQPQAVKGKLKQDLLPLLLKPMSRLAIEPLPPGDSKTWTSTSEVISIQMKEPAGGTNRFGLVSRNPFGGMPGYSRYGSGRQASTSDAEISTLERVASYEIQSQDENELRVAQTISITPKDSTDGDVAQLNLQATGYYVFDKIKNCVVESELAGTAEMETENVTVKIPIKFTSKLRSIKTKEELAADRTKRDADRKKRSAEQAKKRKEMAAKTGSDSSEGSAAEPKKFQATESEAGRVPNQLVAEFPDLGWGVDSLAFSPKGVLYAGKMDRAIFVFDFKKRKKIDERTKLEDLGQVKVTTVSPNGKYLLTGGYTGRIDVWNLKNNGTLKEGESFAGHSKEIQTITVSPDSKLAISGGSDKRVRIWDIETCKEIAAFDGFKKALLATHIAEDNSYAFASDGYSLMKIDLATNKMVSNPKVFTSYPHAATFTPDGKKLAISEGYNVHLIDTTSFVEEVVLEGSRNIHYGLKFDQTGKYLFAGGRYITQWDWEKGESVNEYHFSDHATIRAIAITSDGEHLASIGSSAGQDLRVFKIRNSAE